ncbi:hypothetical protein CH063_10324 [Colletotrichum higginsianum]|uniref:Uncharacterized protein n=1 Tax=Colletotrichum higginsianum (strain IMI 349063) TaxID=759273 RepID=H1VH07_COLHI|nr:hypothetical protein CH063_10324 [Colletotrichum higginsianum]
MYEQQPVPWRAVTRNWAGQVNRGYVRAMQIGTDEPTSRANARRSSFCVQTNRGLREARRPLEGSEKRKGIEDDDLETRGVQRRGNRLVSGGGCRPVLCDLDEWAPLFVPATGGRFGIWRLGGNNTHWIC